METGHYLGDFTDELLQYETKETDDPNIDEFICVAHKVCGTKIKRNKSNDKPIEIIKVKGHTLNPKTGTQINFENLKTFFEGNFAIGDDFINVNQKRIRVGKYFNIQTIDDNKKLQFSFDKRILLANFSSIPWGYNH